MKVVELLGTVNFLQNSTNASSSLDEVLFDDPFAVGYRAFALYAEGARIPDATVGKSKSATGVSVTRRCGALETPHCSMVKSAIHR